MIGIGQLIPAGQLPPHTLSPHYAAAAALHYCRLLPAISFHIGWAAIARQLYIDYLIFRRWLFSIFADTLLITLHDYYADKYY